MGGSCSRKRDQVVDEDILHRGHSDRYSKSGNSKWLGISICPVVDVHQGGRRAPSLLDLCIGKICQDISKYSTLSMTPRDISQQIFNELVYSQRLTLVSLESFRDCALEEMYLREYPGVDDSWMDVISSQRSSLLSVDLSGSEVTDSGLTLLKDCSNLLALSFRFCDNISDCGLKNISGFTNLTCLSLRKNSKLTANGMSSFASLVNLEKLDLERCPGIHGGLVHLEGLVKLESLSIKCCICITDSDMQPITGLTNLKALQMSCSQVTDDGIAYLRGLHNLVFLNLEGCPVTAASLDTLSGFEIIMA